MEKIVNRCLIVSFFLGALFGVLAYLTRNEPHASEAGGEFTFPLLRYLDIDLQKLDVELIPYDGEEITVEYKNDRPLEMEVGDNTLTITESDRFIVSLFAGKESEFGLKLYLPRTKYRDIAIYTGAGNVKIRGVECGKLSAITDSGDIEIDDMSYLASLVTTDGRIKADITTLVRDTDILNRNGNIDITIPPESSVSIDFRTKDGECRTDKISGQIDGDYLYAWNGGKTRIGITAEHGIFTVTERK